MEPGELTTDAVRDRCTDAVFDRGQTYLADGRLRRTERVGRGRDQNARVGETGRIRTERRY